MNKDIPRIYSSSSSLIIMMVFSSLHTFWVELRISVFTFICKTYLFFSFLGTRNVLISRYSSSQFSLMFFRKLFTFFTKAKCFSTFFCSKINSYWHNNLLKLKKTLFRYLTKTRSAFTLLSVFGYRQKNNVFPLDNLIITPNLQK